MRLNAEEIRSVARGATDGSWSEGQLARLPDGGRHPRAGRARRPAALTLAMLRVGRALGPGARGPAPLRQALDRRRRRQGVAGDRAAARQLRRCPSSCSPAAASATPAAPSTSWRASPGWTCGSTAPAASTSSPAAAWRSAAPPPASLPPTAASTPCATSPPPSTRIPLITASILSKKLATGAAAVVFDVKTGNGAFLPELDRSLELARGLVETAARPRHARRAAWSPT